MLDRVNRAFAARTRKMTLSVGHADLTAATNGLEQDLLIGTLPPNAVILDTRIKITTYFTGGSATAVTCAVGTGAGGDPDMVYDELNVFDTTTTGIWLPGTAGVQPSGPISSSAQALYAQFDCDASHTLLGLTAGALDILVLYTVPDVA